MPTSHPLDPLSPAEISSVREAVLAAPEHRAMARRARFITVETRPPEKAALEARIEAIDRGDPAAGARSRADVVLLDRADASTHEIVVALDDGGIVEWRRLDGVQPLAVVEELAEAEELVKRDPDFQAALAKRGVDRLRGRPDRRLAGRQLRRPERAGPPPGPLPRLPAAAARATASGRTRSRG